MKVRFLAVLLALAMAAGVGAQPNPAPPVKKDKPKAAVVKKGVRPAWAELTAEQQTTLAPLKNDWDTLEQERRQKWLQIAKRYPRMKPLEQERVQRRMQIWANLSPEQRRQARENYKQLAKSKRPANKDLRQAWAEYQALAPQERESLAPSPTTDPRRPKRTN